MLTDHKGVRVSVPATSANLGPGFDVLGLALDLHNTFVVMPAGKVIIETESPAVDLPLDESNLFYKAFSFLFGQAQGGPSAPPVHIKMNLVIPPGSGLGSSATAVVGGLVAANALLGNCFNNDTLVRFAVQLEHGNHADNVAPALLGGLVVNVFDPAEGAPLTLSVPFPGDLKVVLLIPEYPMDTVKGRSLMPSHYPKADVVFSTGRVALLLSALQTRRYDLLRIAMQDKMHQPYRTQIYPLLPDLIESALAAGAYGACLSGGGSSILAFADVGGAQAVGEALLKAAASAGLSGKIRIVDVDREGAKAVLL